MQIKIKRGNRGPEGSVHTVYMKVKSWTGGTWYVMKHVRGYHCDSSRIEDEDRIVYRHSYAIEENGFIFGNRLPSGFSFIGGNECEEILYTKNEEAKSLLAREW